MKIVRLAIQALVLLLAACQARDIGSRGDPVGTEPALRYEWYPFTFVELLSATELTIAIGTVGPIASTSEVRRRTEVTADRRTLIRETEFERVGFSAEWVFYAKPEDCLARVLSGDLDLDSIAQTVAVYPRYLDPDGSVVVRQPVLDNYFRRRPEMALRPGERVILLSACPSKAFCSRAGESCLNQIHWKFPIVGSLVDFSAFGGPSALSPQEAAEYLIDLTDGRWRVPVQAAQVR